METTQIQEEHPNFDTVWAILQETAAMQKEIARRQEETDRQMKETDRIVKNNNRLIGDLGNRFGEMIEYMVVPNLLEKFHDLGFVFDKAYNNTAIKDRMNNIFTQVDITLENGDKVMIVEVKSKPDAEDIKTHIQRMEKVKTHAAYHGDKRKFLGAIAGVVFLPDVKEYALRQGFYAIEPSGETFNITPPNDQPREW
jgi:hypothetical protein